MATRDICSKNLITMIGHRLPPPPSFPYFERIPPICDTHSVAASLSSTRIRERVETERPRLLQAETAQGSLRDRCGRPPFLVDPVWVRILKTTVYSYYLILSHIIHRTARCSRRPSSEAIFSRTQAKRKPKQPVQRGF